MERRMMALEQWPCSKCLQIEHCNLSMDCRGLRYLHCERNVFCVNE